MVTMEELEKKIKTEDIDFLYLLYGEERFILENIVKKIKNRFGELTLGINYILLDETNVNNVIDEINAPAFGYNKKLIIIKNSGLFKKEAKRKSIKEQDLTGKIVEYILQNKNSLKQMCVIVFLEEIVEKNDLFNLIDKEGIVCNFEKLKPVQTVKRLKSICNAYHVNVDDNTLNYFVQCVGCSLQEDINEIRKLIEYVGENGNITKKIIDELCVKQTEAVIFDLTDYLGNKNSRFAISTLKDLIYQKEPIQRLLIMIYNHFKKLYFTKLASKYNKDIAESLNLKQNQLFLVSKYKKQASYFEEETLREILQELINLDANYKIRTNRFTDWFRSNFK